MKKQKPTGRGAILTKMSHHVSFAIASELEHNCLSLEEGISVLSSGVCEVLDTLADISDKKYIELREHFCEYIMQNPKI